MKKNSLLICGLISLSLVGCNSSNFDMSYKATREEVFDFLKDKNLDDEKYGALNFKIEIERESKSKNGSSYGSAEINGRVISNNKTIEVYYKGKSSVKSTSYSADGKDTEKLVIEEELTSVASNNKNLYYINNKIKYTSDYLSYEYKNKVKALDADESEFGDYIDDIVSGDLYFDIELSDNNIKYYFDGDDLAAVYSTSSMHSVVIFHCDGNDLKSIEMSNETAEMTTRIEYDFSDVERISIPKDAREYEDLTNINE